MAAGNVKVLLIISDLKPLCARWIVEMYDYLKQQKGAILNGFDKTGIKEAVKLANKVFERIENPLQKNERCRFFSCSFFLTEENH